MFILDRNTELYKLCDLEKVGEVERVRIAVLPTSQLRLQVDIIPGHAVILKTS